MYELFLTRRALRYYGKVDVPTARQLNRCFDSLREDPFASGDIRPLKGDRCRFGDLRLIYQVDITLNGSSLPWKFCLKGYPESYLGTEIDRGLTRIHFLAACH